jgi:hypothetical protein
VKGLVLTAGVFLALVGLPVAAQPPQAASEVKSVALSPVRLPDGHPNWTGFWIPPGGMLDVYRGPSGVTGVPAGNIPRPRTDGLQLKSPYKEQYEAVQAEAAKGPLPDPLALCFPPGMPRMMGMIYGMEILQTPNIISITSEWQAATRRVWMDLKSHPPAEELDDTYAGHSIGHWEGDTLVVDTVGVRKDVTLDQSRTPHSPKMHIVERFTQTGPGVLVDDMVVNDTDAFVAPIKQTRTYRYRPDLRLQEYTCLENNRNVDPDSGKATFK